MRQQAGSGFTPARYAQVVVPGWRPPNVGLLPGDNYLDLAGNEKQYRKPHRWRRLVNPYQNADNSLANFDAPDSQRQYCRRRSQDCVLGNVRSGASIDHVSHQRLPDESRLLTEAGRWRHAYFMAAPRLRQQ